MESGKAYLRIDKRWNMEELAELSKLYYQCYSLMYSLSPFQVDSDDQRVVDWFKGIYSKFPWRGGFSTVNFYFSLFSKIPYEGRPNITRIQYASPGFIELQEAVVVASSVATIVAAIAVSFEKVHDLFHKIQIGISERKLARMKVALSELELDSAQLKFIRESKAQLLEAMNVSVEMKLELTRRCDGNELMELKILMSLYRRAEPLAKMQLEGKLKVELPSRKKEENGDET
jgi:hypothetical protein